MIGYKQLLTTMKIAFRKSWTFLLCFCAFASYSQSTQRVIDREKGFQALRPGLPLDSVRRELSAQPIVIPSKDPSDPTPISYYTSKAGDKKYQTYYGHTIQETRVYLGHGDTLSMVVLFLSPGQAPDSIKADMVEIFGPTTCVIDEKNPSTFSCHWHGKKYALSLNSMIPDPKTPAKKAIQVIYSLEN